MRRQLLTLVVYNFKIGYFSSLSISKFGGLISGMGKQKSQLNGNKIVNVITVSMFQFSWGHKERSLRRRRQQQYMNRSKAEGIKLRWISVPEKIKVAIFRLKIRPATAALSTAVLPKMTATKTWALPAQLSF
ncbi:hypothetical protein COLO4_35943 [Corchorus olitorius]|uniref:Uncharacterized protein n=1 Tax=Corchorus olitorius TaxID=93759 RepID=A0A1R3GBQ3_9ROSI|nr:hypothetical protein COLO4_35943 [Corchorus olitorius]